MSALSGEYPFSTGRRKSLPKLRNGSPFTSKESISEMRCVTLEAIAAKVHFLCPNSIYGCNTRLPHDLMKWHNERCVYQRITCFLGQVWGGCEWTGCKINWMDHCWEKHADRMYNTSPVAIQWEYRDCQRIRPLVGYYILHVFDEIFNVYHIYDKRDCELIYVYSSNFTLILSPIFSENGVDCNLGQIIIQD
jgi:Seven in absentia protein family